MEKISWTDRLKKEEELHRVKEERNFLHKKRREANCICYILLRACLLNHIILGKIQGRQK